MNQRVRPKSRIPRSAVAIHGIDRKMLKHCPLWPDVEGEIRKLLSNRPVITYNAAFEVRLLDQTAARWKCEPIAIDSHCAMLAHAEHRGIRIADDPDTNGISSPLHAHMKAFHSSINTQPSRTRSAHESLFCVLHRCEVYTQPESQSCVSVGSTSRSVLAVMS